MVVMMMAVMVMVRPFRVGQRSGGETNHKSECEQ
jgi:hypothetical protein